MRNAGLLAIHGAPEGPQDLFNHNRLLLKFPGSPPCRWTFRTPEVPLTLPVQGRMDADDGDTLFRWALAGSFLSPFLKLPTASRRHTGTRFADFPTGPGKPSPSSTRISGCYPPQ
jgi:hypothetical protein